MKPYLSCTPFIALVLGLFLFTSCEKKEGLGDDDDLQEEFDDSKNVAHDAAFNLKVNGENWEVKSYDVGLAYISTASLESGVKEGVSCWRVVAYNQTLGNRKPASKLDSLVFHFVMPFKGVAEEVPALQKGAFPLLAEYDGQALHIEYKGGGVFRPDFSSGEIPGVVNITKGFEWLNSRFGYWIEGDFSMTLFPVGSNSPSAKKEIQGSFSVPDGEWNMP